MFRPDSVLMRLLDRLATLVMLNIYFLLCCLPLVTIGASTTALYTVTLQEARGDARSITASFFRAFRKNFWKATVLWLFVAFFTAVFVIDLVLFTRNGAPRFLRILLCIAGIFFALMLPYLFPLKARFENTLRMTLRNALMLGIAKLPSTLLMLLMLLLPLILLYISEQLFWRLAIFWVLLGFALTAQFCSYLLHRIFSKITDNAA